MSYRNWKDILVVFSFHNSVFNVIFVIKHTWKDPLVRSTAPFDLFFFSIFFLLLGSVSSFFFFFGSSSPLIFGLQFFLSFFFSFFFPSSFIGFKFLGFFFFFFLLLLLLLSLGSVSLGFFFSFFTGFNEFRY